MAAWTTPMGSTRVATLAVPGAMLHYEVQGAGPLLPAPQPGLVRTLVAFEPPATELLPDRERWRAFYEDLHRTYRTQGLSPALREFAEGAGLGAGEPPDPDPGPET